MMAVSESICSLDFLFPFKCRGESLINILIRKIFRGVLSPRPGCARALFMACNYPFTLFIEDFFKNRWTGLVAFTSPQERTVAWLYRPWISMQKGRQNITLPLPPKKREMGRKRLFLHVKFLLKFFSFLIGFSTVSVIRWAFSSICHLSHLKLAGR